MRITGGHAGNRRLAVPKGLTVRPTPDLVRQAVFNSLGDRVVEAEILDLFSGSGALGLECLSRGAARVLSVELSSRHARILRDNVAELGLDSTRHELRVQDAFAALRQLADGDRRFDLILADPPFGPKTGPARSTSLSQKLADAPEAQRVLKPDGLLVLGHARRDGVRVPAELWEELRVLTHGDSVFRLLRPRAAAGATPPTAVADGPSGG